RRIALSRRFHRGHRVRRGRGQSDQTDSRTGLWPRHRCHRGRRRNPGGLPDFCYHHPHALDIMTNPYPPFGDPSGEQYPWRRHPPAPIDPHAPISYPEYPPPPVPLYGYPHPHQGGAMGYGGPRGYASLYDPFQVPPPETNGLATGSLITSIAGVVLG